MITFRKLPKTRPNRKVKTERKLLGMVSFTRNGDLRDYSSATTPHLFDTGREPQEFRSGNHRSYPVAAAARTFRLKCLLTIAAIRSDAWPSQNGGTELCLRSPFNIFRTPAFSLAGWSISTLVPIVIVTGRSVLARNVMQGTFKYVVSS